MKTIPYVLLLTLALIVLFTHCEKDPEPVNFPDDAFLNALIEEGVDKNGDGKISHAEAEVVRSLDVREDIIFKIAIGDGCNLCTSLDQKTQVE